MLGSTTRDRKPRKFSDQARANMAAAHRGRQHSVEHRQAIAAGVKPENTAKASSAAAEAIARQLEELGAVKLTDALAARGIDYATGYEWATYRRSDRLRPPVFRGPRRILCVRGAELDAELERWRCRREHCERYALLSETGLCHEHRVSDVLREFREREYATARRQKGLLLASDVAGKIGVSRPYLTRLVAGGRLATHWRDVAGIRVMVFAPADVREFQRSRPVNRWHDPEWVKDWALDHERDRALAAKLGISRSAALERILALVAVRRRRPPGRPASDQPTPHHLEWLQRYLTNRDYYERRAAAGDPMPKPTQICREVAVEDYLEHPERWPDYEPGKLTKEAGARVWGAVKPLLIAESQIPAS